MKDWFKKWSPWGVSQHLSEFSHAVLFSEILNSLKLLSASQHLRVINYFVINIIEFERRSHIPFLKAGSYVADFSQVTSVTFPWENNRNSNLINRNATFTKLSSQLHCLTLGSYHISDVSGFIRSLLHRYNK